jgi:hypothetical protein
VPISEIYLMNAPVGLADGSWARVVQLNTESQIVNCVVAGMENGLTEFDNVHGIVGNSAIYP